MKSLLTLALASLLTVAASAKVTEKFSQTYPLAANGTIHVGNFNGSIEIVAWDKAEVALEAEKSANNDEALARIHLKIDSGPTRLKIKTEQDKSWKFWDTANAAVHYKLMVPAGVSLDKIEVVNSDIHVTGVKGSVDLETVNGSIDAKNLGSHGKFETVNGSITVVYATPPTHDDEISLETVNGSCTLKLPASASFRLEADTVNGRVNCDFPITLEKSGKHDLRGTVAGGGAEVKLESVNGGLSVVKLD